MKKSLRRKPQTIPLNYFLKDEDTKGHTKAKTLLELMGDMLLMTEGMFGARDLNYTLLGVEFSPSGGCIWNQRDSKYIIVQLDMNALCDYPDACRQLAHESIHLLSPTGKRDANVLEEGLAIYFEQYYMQKAFGSGWWNNEISVKSYRTALRLVKQLLDIESDAIRMLRIHEPTIAHISADLIVNVCPGVSKLLANKLAKPFY